MNYSEYLEFCTTARQKEVFEALVQGRSKSALAKELEISRSTVRSVIKEVQQKAENRGFIAKMKEIGTVPEGFYAETSVKRRLNPETGEMDVIEDWTKSKKSKDAKDSESFLSVIEGLKTEIKPARPTKYSFSKYSTDLASAVIFGDPHIGMLAHAVETLGEDYDMDKCIHDMKQAIDYCVDCAPASEEGWFINVGDLTHSNDTKHETPGHGHGMDMSARHNQTMRAAGAVIRYCITKMLTKFKTVKVINARGNHDKDSAFALNMFLEAVYEKEPRVSVFGNDSKFNFIEFGKNLIGVNHGDGINDNRLAGVMTRCAAEAWGRTRYRRFWTGHIHHKTKREHDSGIIFESMPVLSPVDSWHSDSGYGAERGVTMITLHKEFGEVMRMEPSIEMVRAFVGKEAA
jgi:hypothetical protein